METSIVGVGVGITDRFRSVVEDKAARIEHLAPRAQRVDIKVTHRAYHNGRMEDDTVELTLTGKGPLVRAEATDGDKFAALDLAVDKLCEQLRRAKDKRVDARNHPRGAKFEKGSGELSRESICSRHPSTCSAPSRPARSRSSPGNEEEADYTPVVIRTKEFDAEWMAVEEAVDRMELVGHDFFLFIDARTDHPSVVYRRKGWDYGVISLTTAAPRRAAVASDRPDTYETGCLCRRHPVSSSRHRARSVEHVAEQAADHEAAEDAAHAVSAAAAAAAPPWSPDPHPPGPPGGRDCVDVALRELEPLAREERDAARHRERLLAMVLVDAWSRPPRRCRGSGRGRRGSARPRPRACARRRRSSRGARRSRRARRRAAGRRRRSRDARGRGAGWTRGALAGGRDRGIQPAVRLAQPRELRRTGRC